MMKKMIKNVMLMLLISKIRLINPVSNVAQKNQLINNKKILSIVFSILSDCTPSTLLVNTCTVPGTVL